MSTLYAMTTATLAEGDGPPAGVATQLNYVLNIIAWLVTAAGVAGLMIVGSRMAFAVKTGDGDEHLSQFLTVMGACVIGATAGPIVGFLL
ncbi:hypothetical protein [Streptomyces sp. NPDC058255]|uniref:hypothetical protein n=1 Tax=Streptomyces sp. NPDC058255 TaxID=3346407 RepID=UPI0036F09293